MKNNLANLISIPSVSGQEGAVIAYIKEILTQYRVDLFPVQGNLVAYIPGIQKRSALIFDVHVDTVSAGDLSKWKFDPFHAVEQHGNMYGLGASDEKVAVATVLALLYGYTKKSPPVDVYVFFVVKEEIDGSGSATVVSWFGKTKKDRYSHVAAILGEPTDLKTIEIAHKGNIFLKLTTSGDSGHGSQPKAIHTHAVEQMIFAMSIVQKLGVEWKKMYNDPILGSPTVGVLTSIQAGDISVPNKFPDTCIATCDIRTTPKLHHRALALLKIALHGVALVDVVCIPVLYGFTEPSAHIVDITKRVTKGKIGISDGSNDLCFFSKAHIPAVVFGPGTKSRIHSPNEYCNLKNIEICVSLYQKILMIYGDAYP